MSDTKICIKCGKELRLQAKFCTDCGAIQPVCKVCGAFLRGKSVKFCNVCGALQKKPLAYLVKHAATGFGLFALLLVILSMIYFWESRSASSAIKPPPPPEKLVEVCFAEDGRFGLTATIGDPGRTDDDGKLLTYDFQGRTNSTIVSVDGETPFFIAKTDSSGDVIVTEGMFKNILFNQTVSLIVSPYTQMMDTIKVEYTAKNLDSVSHNVGLRVMLDTLIGDNDGVPFIVAGRDAVTDQGIEFRGTDVPDFIQAIENPDFANPGLVVKITFRGLDGIVPDRVLLSGWPEANAEWDYFEKMGGTGSQFVNLRGKSDSAVGIYYEPRVLQSGEQIKTVFLYGLGDLKGGKNLALIVPANIQLKEQLMRSEGNTFWITALVMNPEDNMQVSLQLPAGLNLVPGQESRKQVKRTPGQSYNQVSWRAEARATGMMEVKVTLEPLGATQSREISVTRE